MFIVSLTYTQDLSEIEKYLSDHIRYLDSHYATGTFLASGRKNPRTGGVILARVAGRIELDRIIAEDPFKIHHLANYDITEFLPSKTAPQLAFLLK